MNSEDFREENKTITIEQVLRLLKNHSVDSIEFYADFGTYTEYSTDEVLTWLGY